MFDQGELVLLLAGMNYKVNDQTHQLLTEWLKQQNLDLDGYIILDMSSLAIMENVTLAELHDLIGYGGSGILDEAQVLNQWCSLYKNNNSSDLWANISMSSGGGRLSIYGDLSNVKIFPDTSGTLPICQVIR